MLFIFIGWFTPELSLKYYEASRFIPPIQWTPGPCIWHLALYYTLSFPICLSLLWHCWLDLYEACKNRPRNGPLCVGWTLKPTLAHSLSRFLSLLNPLRGPATQLARKVLFFHFTRRLPTSSCFSFNIFIYIYCCSLSFNASCFPVVVSCFLAHTLCFKNVLFLYFE